MPLVRVFQNKRLKLPEQARGRGFDRAFLGIGQRQRRPDVDLELVRGSLDRKDRQQGRTTGMTDRWGAGARLRGLGACLRECIRRWLDQRQPLLL